MLSIVPPYSWLEFFKYYIRCYRYVSTSYAEVASLAFGSRPFSLTEFSSKIATRRAGRILSELKVRGLVERLARGRYRVLPPDERPDLRGVEWKRVHRLLLDSRLPMAWTDADAVRVWTGGRYAVSPSAFLLEFHIEVPESSIREWRDYLRAHRVVTDPRRRIGTKVVILPTRRFRFTKHKGEPVISRKATLAEIKAHRGLYANADRLIES